MPKSSTFTSPSAGHHDVGGLEIAMQDQLLVRVVHGAADLAKEAEPLVESARDDADSVIGAPATSSITK